MHQRAATATWTGSGGASWDDTIREGVARPGVPSVPSLPAVPAVKARGLHLGSYRVLGLLGEGGMARVYLAEHTLIGKRVAIKRLLPHLAHYHDARELFLREARIAGAVRHPNVIDVYDFGNDDDGLPFYVMELASGEPLASRLARAPLLVSQALDVGIALADAVKAVHNAGFLHRDIKSENVLLTRHRRRLVPKLIDFGIARPLAGGPEGEPAGMVGTPRTMAPEQIAQDAVDERTDIWALGVMLHEMITADLPFRKGECVQEDLMTILTEQPQPLPGTVPLEIRSVVAACLRKDPDQRPPNCGALAERLRLARSEYLSRHGMTERGPDDDDELD